MIGGTDIVIPAKGVPETLDACARMVREYWPMARFENALTGEKFRQYADVPFGYVRELLIYPDPEAESAWDQSDADAAPNSMLYLILSSESVTIVLDDPIAEPMQSMLHSIHDFLRAGKVNTFAEAA